MAELAYDLAYDDCFEHVTDASAAFQRSLSASTGLQTLLVDTYEEGFVKGGGAAVKPYLPSARKGCMDGIADAL